MRATLRGLRALSWEHACKIGEQLGALGYRPLGIRKRVVERQIAAAFPELGPTAVVRLARESYKHLGRTFVETALLDSLGKDGVQRLVETVDGWDDVDDVMRKGRCVRRCAWNSSRRDCARNGQPTFRRLHQPHT
jgi:lauroyl/myristoyl acyltransferase